MGMEKVFLASSKCVLCLFRHSLHEETGFSPKSFCLIVSREIDFYYAERSGGGSESGSGGDGGPRPRGFYCGGHQPQRRARGSL